MTPRELAAAIREYVQSYDYVSFAELDRKFPEHFGHGNREILIAGANLLIWTNLTDIAVEALEIVQHDYKEITLAPAPVLVYFIDGKVLRMDIAKRPPKGGYKTRRWAPTVLSLTEEERRTRRRRVSRPSHKRTPEGA